MAEDATPRHAKRQTKRHASTLSSLNIVHEHNKLNRTLTDFPLRKQGAVISLSGSRDCGGAAADSDVSVGTLPLGPLGSGTLPVGPTSRRSRDRVRKIRKISTLSAPEGKDATEALVLLRNGNHGDPCFLAEDSAEDEDVDEDDDEEAEDMGDEASRRVPDGGWGWAVVAAAFFINMASDGISFSFGLLYIEFLRYFGESRSTTSWIGSLFMAVPMLTGPVASAMVDRYGCRAMTIVGGVVSAIGFMIAASSSTIGQMYLTFGVLAGLGLGLCFITAVVSIAYWFERKRTLAMSLGAAGTGFGTFIYAPMTNYFISEYGWRGTVLLLAGTFLNLCVCGVVMRDPAWWADEQRHQRRLGRRGVARSTEASEGSAVGVEVPVEATELLPLAPQPPLAVPLSRVARSLPYTRPMSMTTRSEDNLASLASCLSRSQGHAVSAPQTPVSTTTPLPFVLATFNTIPELEQHDVEESSPEEAGSTPLLLSSATTPLVASALAVAVAGAAAMPVQAVQATPVRRSNSSSPFGSFGSSPLRTESLPCFRRRVSLSNTPATPLCPTGPAGAAPLSSTTAIPERRRTLSFKGASPSGSSCCPSFLRRGKDATHEKRWYSDTVDLVRAMLDFSLFLELHFLLMSVGTTLLYTWFVVPYFYLADHLIRNGYTESEASCLLGIVGVANTVGMVVLGWVGDHPRLNVTKTYALCLTVCGTATAAMLVFTDQYWLLVLACAAFGVTFASTFSFTPTILVTLVPMERFTIAYGLNLLCQGIGNLLGPPFAGWLFDLTHSWDLSFYMAGLWIVVAGILTGLISYTNNRHLFSKLTTVPGSPGAETTGVLAEKRRAETPVATTPSKSSSSTVGASTSAIGTA